MKCSARNTRGQPCGAEAVRGSRRCFWHSPATAHEARDARRRGGQNRMLALRPDAVLAPSSTTAIVPRGSADPPSWVKLETRADLLGAVRDVARATLARKLDPKTANTSLLALQTLLGEERERRAAKRAKREWARMQLRDRLESLGEDAEHLERSAPEGSRIREQLGRFENEIEYVRSLAKRARI